MPFPMPHEIAFLTSEYPFEFFIAIDCFPYFILIITVNIFRLQTYEILLK